METVMLADSLLLDLPTLEQGRWLFRSRVSRHAANLTPESSKPVPSQHSPCPPDSDRWAARWLPLTGPHATALTSCAKAMLPNSFGGLLCMCLCVWCMLRASPQPFRFHQLGTGGPTSPGSHCEGVSSRHYRDGVPEIT